MRTLHSRVARAVSPPRGPSAALDYRRGDQAGQHDSIPVWLNFALICRRDRPPSLTSCMRLALVVPLHTRARSAHTSRHFCHDIASLSFLCPSGTVSTVPSAMQLPGYYKFQSQDFGYYPAINWARNVLSVRPLLLRDIYLSFGKHC